MGVLQYYFFLPSSSDGSKNHPSRHGSIALTIPEVPKMYVRAICFTSSGSNGGCWVFLVIFCFYSETKFLFHARLTPKKNLHVLRHKKGGCVVFHNQPTFSCASYCVGSTFWRAACLQRLSWDMHAAYGGAALCPCSVE